ncbi:MAG: 30S ribosomal protein S8 [Thermoplasmata archaeon]
MNMDPLNNALNTIKHAAIKGIQEVEVKPASKLIGRILKIMQEYSYISEFEFIENNQGGKFKVKVVPVINGCGVIKPRFSVKNKDIEKYERRLLPAQDFGILIISTNHGIMTHKEAKKNGLGGKLIAYVY